MGSFSAAVRNAWLNALANGVSYSNAAVWVQLHLGDPGALGTANPAANGVRMLGTFGVPSAGTCSNTGAVTWPSVPTTETYSHVSLWSAASAGTFLGSDALPAPVSVVAADPFAISIGDLVLAVT